VQIASSLPSTLQVQFPSVYKSFAGSLAQIFNIDAFHLVSIGCLYNANFHTNLLMTTITPLLLALALLVLTQVQCAFKKSNHDAAQLKSSRFSTFLGLSYIVFVSASTMAFTTFLCKQYGDDETHYLIADRSIDCGSDSHKAYQVFALIMVLVYPIGVTTMYVGRTKPGEERSEWVVRTKTRREATIFCTLIADRSTCYYRSYS